MDADHRTARPFVTSAASASIRVRISAISAISAQLLPLFLDCG